MKRLTLIALIAGLVASACAGAGSGSLGPGPTASPSPTGEASPSPSPSATPTKEPTSSPLPTQTPNAPFTYEVWFARLPGAQFQPDERLFVTARTEPFNPGVARMAITALLAGPNADETAAGVSSAIPAGTRLLGLNLEDGTLTVDLSSAFQEAGGSFGERMRLAQLVYTATQFDTVEGVRLAIDGRVLGEFGGHGIDVSRPLVRRDFEDMLPAIVVESPSIGARVDNPVVIAGTANVFEATVSIRILDANGNEIARTFTTATCGSGCRGDYSAPVRYSVASQQRGMVEVYESSAADGSATHVQSIPVTLTP